MNTDKAYLLGLIIGGGVFGNAEDVFRIRLPYKKWGSYLENPQRAGRIAQDILMKVGPMFRAIYNISVQYEASQSTWVILCEGDITPVRNDLQHYGIAYDGEIRKNANIELLILDLVDDNLKRRFIAGLADTIGSMTKSQRRFSNEHQILSFEIAGHNFKLVCDLCHLLYSINCIPDQVNWNHPNIHCPSDPYYTQWSKGFKLRILLDQYSRFGAFAFRTKAVSSNENRCLQQETHEAGKCEDREIHVTPSTVHPAENDIRLPDVIRGGHYIHFRHFCTVLGCEHAPYGAICSHFNELGTLVNPFPILTKESNLRIDEIIHSEPLYSQRNYTIINVSIQSLLSLNRQSNETSLLYGNNQENGYPITEILKSVAYIVANDDELNGKRPSGNYITLIERHLAANSSLTVEFRKPDLLTPVVLVGNGRGALIGAVNPRVYEKLISHDPTNEYKILVRKITEEDLRSVN